MCFFVVFLHELKCIPTVLTMVPNDRHIKTLINAQRRSSKDANELHVTSYLVVLFYLSSSKIGNEASNYM